MKATQLIPKCYSRGCNNKAVYKWLPNKNKGHLYVCQEDYDLLASMFCVEPVGEEGDLKVVRVVPEPEE